MSFGGRFPMTLAPECCDAIDYVLLGAIWGEAAMIIPETRFLIVFHVAVWLLGVAAAVQWRSAARG